MINKLFKKYFNAKTLAIAFFAVTVFFAMVVIYFSKDLPDIKNLGNRVINESFTIYDRTETVILYDQTQAENRQYLKFDEIPDIVKYATMAAEDDSFYRHHGIVWKSLIKAVYLNIVTFGNGPGGSTITQQLARNAFLTTERSASRKIKEMILSFYLERQYTKDEIFEMYLNQVPYGFNAYGVESASQLYFSKSAKDLNLEEAAYLASLLKAPTYLSPFGNNRERLDVRKDWVLQRMVKFGWAEEKQVEILKANKSDFKTKRQTILAPHFVAFVQSQLVDKYGEDFVQKGGLKIITTLDYDLQKKAEEVVSKYGDSNEERFGIKNMALLSQDSKTGQILAMVGSRDFWDYNIDGNYNAVFGLRQPGSSFKPFVYLSLFEKGYSPDTVVFDVKTNFSVDPNNPYIPQNYDKIFRGPVNLRNSLAQSLNIPAVKALYLTGIDDVLKLAERFGITTLTGTKNEYGLPLVLGGGAVNLYDLVGAYSVLSEEGIKHSQKFILKIVDGEGKVIEEYKDDSSHVYNSKYIRMINDVLSDNTARTPLFGTVNNPFFFGNNIDVAAKTGTSSDSKDAWVLGYTPNLVTGIWVGNNNYTSMFQGTSSGMVAAPAWGEYMRYAISTRPVEYFSNPEYTYVDKPMLNGQHINQMGNTIQAHSILFYVDKNDPLGAIPKNPQNDPQFLNWETPVLEWLRSVISGFDNIYNKPLENEFYNKNYKTIAATTTTTLEQSDDIAIEFLNIKNDQEVLNNIELKIKIVSGVPLEQKMLFVNNNYFGDLVNKGDNIYSILLTSDVLQETNEIKVHVQDTNLNIKEQALKVLGRTQ